MVCEMHEIHLRGSAWTQSTHRAAHPPALPARGSGGCGLASEMLQNNLATWQTLDIFYTASYLPESSACNSSSLSELSAGSHLACLASSPCSVSGSRASLHLRHQTSPPWLQHMISRPRRATRAQFTRCLAHVCQLSPIPAPTPAHGTCAVVIAEKMSGAQMYELVCSMHH